MPFADQVRPKLREFAFPELRELLEQFLAGYQRQHRISQKFQLLVIADLVLTFARLLRFLLSRLRTVRNRLLNDGPPPKMVAQSLFQRRDFPFLHMWDCHQMWGQSSPAVRRAQLDQPSSRKRAGRP
jgi:hypothetical protein